MVWRLALLAVMASTSAQMSCAHGPEEELKSFAIMPAEAQRRSKKVGPITAQSSDDFAHLSVEVHKRLCWVKVGGTFLGRDPIVDEKLPPGRHEVVISCGKRNWIRKMRFEAGEAKHLVFSKAMRLTK